jgi:acyl phosphate:glycerol-3-phosphate acyltransferase
MTTLIILLIFGYFVGSLPFGVWIARAHGIDIQKVGSGNVGATNVSRALGKGWGIGVFVLDMTKGLVPSLLGRFLVKEPIDALDPQFLWFLIGFAAIAGHVKSPFLGFKGGKGVSTAMGAGLGAAPVIALSAFAIFIVVLVVFQYMVVASVVGIWSAVVISFVLPSQSLPTSGLFLLLAVFVTFLHRTNFARLLKGEEPKFKFRK